MNAKTRIEVAYATLEKQMILECEVDQGCTVRQAVKSSGIEHYFPEIDLDNCEVGIFGKAVPPEQGLNNGDRIEIYRPLIADPKEVRRKRAEAEALLAQEQEQAAGEK